MNILSIEQKSQIVNEVRKIMNVTNDFYVGCAYCSSKNTTVGRIEKNSSNKFKLVVCCDDCDLEDWISVDAKKLAEVAVLLA